MQDDQATLTQLVAYALSVLAVGTERLFLLDALADGVAARDGDELVPRGDDGGFGEESVGVGRSRVPVYQVREFSGPGR